MENTEKKYIGCYARVLPDLLRQSVESMPGNKLLQFQQNSFTYSQIYSFGLKAAAGLIHSGIKPGDAVGIILNNSPNFVSLFFAILFCGARVIAIAPHSSLKRTEKIVVDGDLKLVVVDEEFLRLNSNKLSTDAPVLHSYMRDIADLLAFDCLDVKEIYHAEPEEIAYMQYTSGSTGVSKGVMLSHRAVLANCRCMSKRLVVNPDKDVFSTMLPLYHDMGLIGFLLFPMYCGTLTLLFRQDIRNIYSWLRSFKDFSATISGASNTMLHLTKRVVADPNEYDMSNLRVLLCGSEPIHSDVVRAFQQAYRVGDVLVPAYGLAEASLCVTMHEPGTPLKFDNSSIIACGKAIDETNIKIIKKSNDDKSGEICVKTTSLMSGYYKNDTATIEVVDNFGYLHTGDSGYVDSEGQLFVLGRVKNIIIRDGVNLLPGEVEMIALRIPEIRNCCVVGIQQKNDGGREQIVLVSEILRSTLDSQDKLLTLKGVIREMLAEEASYQPDRYLFVSAGRLPVSLNGKMQHQMVREMVYEYGAITNEYREI